MGEETVAVSTVHVRLRGKDHWYHWAVTMIEPTEHGLAFWLASTVDETTGQHTMEPRVFWLNASELAEVRCERDLFLAAGALGDRHPL